MNNTCSPRSTESSLRKHSQRVPCTLVVSEIRSFPVQQQSRARNHACSMLPDPLESDLNLSEVMPMMGNSSRWSFVAPTFAEMMLDQQKLQLTLAAIQAGAEIIPPQSKHGIPAEVVSWNV